MKDIFREDGRARKDEESGKQCIAVPTLRKLPISALAETDSFMLVEALPQSPQNTKLCSGTQDKSCGYAIFQIAKKIEGADSEIGICASLVNPTQVLRGHLLMLQDVQSHPELEVIFFR